MILDLNLVFSDSQDLAITASASSTTVIDLTGAQTMEIGNGSAFGADMGVGDGPALPKIGIYCTEALTTTNSATLNIQFQGNAVASSAADGNWITYIETGPLAASSFVVSTKVAGFDYPIVPAGVDFPRWIRLNYSLGTGQFSTGALSAYIMLQREDWTAGQYPSGFSVGE